MMKRTNYYFPRPMLARLKQAAALKEMSKSEFLRNALEAALRRMKL
jgi:hypothetical protein